MVVDRQRQNRTAHSRDTSSNFALEYFLRQTKHNFVCPNCISVVLGWGHSTVFGVLLPLKDGWPLPPPDAKWDSNNVFKKVHRFVLLNPRTNIWLSFVFVFICCKNWAGAESNPCGIPVACWGLAQPGRNQDSDWKTLFSCSRDVLMGWYALTLAQNADAR